MRQQAASFLPSHDGFAFTNSWPSAPAISVPTPFGSIGVGNASLGLCGGMVFAALDYWGAQAKPPTAQPAPATPLFRFIVKRLIDSWHIPAGVAEYYQWMNLPDADTSFSLLGRTLISQRGLSWRTIEQQWPQVKASLDSGQPAALGIVTVASPNPGTLGNNHQVLAYAYQLTPPVVTLRVYDPNTGPADDVHIMFSTAAPAAATTFVHNINIGWPVRGFFLTGYSPASPPGVVRPLGNVTFVDWKIELVAIPVTDVDRAKAFYTDQVGFNADHDYQVNENLRFVQLTPPGSACSIVMGTGITEMPPGSQRGVQIVVPDVATARKSLLEHGVQASEIDVQPWGSFVTFADPDGNTWALQEVPSRG